eukprot:1156443-Pelagomonas_calceolata.AAC.9
MQNNEAWKQARLGPGKSSMPASQILIALPPTGLNLGLPPQIKTKGKKNAWVWEQYEKKQVSKPATAAVQEGLRAVRRTVRSRRSSSSSSQEGSEQMEVEGSKQAVPEQRMGPGWREGAASMRFVLSQAWSRMLAAPRLAPTPSKGGRDGRGESAKLKKDLDKLQVEHAKLQMSLKAKMGEVEKASYDLSC